MHEHRHQSALAPNQAAGNWGCAAGVSRAQGMGGLSAAAVCSHACFAATLIARPWWLWVGADPHMCSPSQL
jgi:hypothetical protein